MSAGHGQCLQSAPARVEPAQASSWKVTYEKVAWESDTERLLISIHATEDALFLRWQELGNDPMDKPERAAMNAAAADLLAIKLHKLGWPG
jgi:hypothetical protein